jgi:hypothetical protein
MKLSTALILLGLILIATAIIHSIESKRMRAAFIAGCVQARQVEMKSDMRMKAVIEAECEQKFEIGRR